jgi:hypothetical protein
MILVTGTKRSGTSMWMQILIAGGFPFFGKDYLGSWDKSIKGANEKGFFESPLRKGVYFATNPDPKTGAFLFPQKTQRHVLKVFIPGLVRTDYAFIGRVVGTIRPWRDYVSSIRRLYVMEDEFLAEQPKKEGDRLPALEMAQLRRPAMHPALEWWRENYDLIRDFATRRYAFNLVSYNRLIEVPSEVVPQVLEWCGGGDTAAAVAAVDPSMRTQKEADISDAPVSAEDMELFDEFHDFFYRQEPLTGSFIQRLNDLDEKLTPQIREAQAAGFQRLRHRLMEVGLSEKDAEKAAEKAQEEGAEPLA